MAARLWVFLLAADALLAALCALLLGGMLRWRYCATLTLAAVIFLIAPWMIASASVLLAAGSGGEASVTARLRAAVTEPAHFALAVARMILEPWRDSPDTSLPQAANPRPVLLLHGIVCNRGIWRGWLRELRSAGFAPVRALNLEPLFADIDVYAARVARELAALQNESRGARVAVITHSMGGLVARAALSLAGPQTIRQIVTLACPHHGSRLARHYPSAPTRQMRQDSAWLSALNLAQEERWPVPVTDIYSLEDNLVVPARSAEVAGADCYVLRGCGHFGVLGSRAARQCVHAALAAA